MPQDMIGCTCGYHPLIEIDMKNTMGYDLIVNCPKCNKETRSTTSRIMDERKAQDQKISDLKKEIEKLNKKITDLQAPTPKKPKAEEQAKDPEPKPEVELEKKDTDSIEEDDHDDDDEEEEEPKEEPADTDDEE